jgi:hypothetical protein
MKENVSKDFIALACLAYRRSDYNTAGKFFALAMDNADSGEFVESLMVDNITIGPLAESLASHSGADDLSSVASSIEDAMKGKAVERRRASLRSDDEDFNDLQLQSAELDDEEDEDVESQSTSVIKSPLSIRIKGSK